MRVRPIATISFEASRLRSGQLDLELSADATRLALLLEQHRANLRASFDADMNRLSEARLCAEKAAGSERRTESDTETGQ